jgi:hypothetical protein
MVLHPPEGSTVPKVTGLAHGQQHGRGMTSTIGAADVPQQVPRRGV